MGIAPSGVLIDGKRYRLAAQDGSYVEEIEPSVQRQAEIPGSSRPGRTTRPDVLTWRLDDWSGGEGRRFFDSSDETTWKKYWRSTAAVDISTPGRIAPGRAFTQSLALTGVSAGPHLAVSRGRPWVLWDKLARECTVLPDTWTARVIAYDGPTGVAGPVDSRGGYLWAGERGAGAEIHRLTTGAYADTKFSTLPAESPILVNNRVYALRDLGTGTPTSRLYELDPAAATPVAPTEVVLVSGTSLFGCLAAIPPAVYWCSQDYEGEGAHLWKYDADAASGYEMLSLPQEFAIEVSQPLRNLVALNNVLFVAGWVPGTPEVAVIQYATDATSGTVAKIRSDVSMRAVSLAALSENHVLIGCSNGLVFQYDMASGAISLFGDAGNSQRVSSMVQASGYCYIATADYTGAVGSVLRTALSGSGTYVATCDIESTTWDFDLPESPKVLLTIEVQTNTLDSGASVEIQVVLDDGSTITTDADGTTMAHTSGTRTTFTLSSAGVERTFRYATIIARLKTSNTANRAELLSITATALPVGAVQFYEVLLDLATYPAQETRAGRQVPAKMYGDLQALRDATSNYLFNFTPLYTDVPGAWNLPSSSHTVTLESMKLESAAGGAVARLRMRKIA